MTLSRLKKSKKQVKFVFARLSSHLLFFFSYRFILAVATDIIPWYSYWPKNMGLKTFERFIGKIVE